MTSRRPCQRIRKSTLCRAPQRPSFSSRCSPSGGCASSAPPARPAARPFDDVKRVVVVVSGDSSFSIVEHAVEPGRTFDEVIKWLPWVQYQAALRPAAQLLHRGINWALGADRSAVAVSSLQGVSPRLVVADAMAKTLEASGWFTDVRTFDREPSARGSAKRRRHRAGVRAGLGSRARARRRARPPVRLRGRARPDGDAGHWRRPVGIPRGRDQSRADSRRRVPGRPAIRAARDDRRAGARGSASRQRDALDSRSAGR